MMASSNIKSNENTILNYKVPAGSNTENLKPIKDFLRPKRSKFKSCAPYNVVYVHNLMKD